MTTTDTTVQNLIINTMTQAEYATITPSGTELYMVTDGVISSSDVTTALGYTPYNSSNPSGYQANVIETIKVNGTAQTVTSKSVNITVPSAVTESTVSGWGFTKNAGTITGITMNGSSKGTSGVVDLGTVITAHQDISGKVDTSAIVGTVSSASTNAEVVGAKLFYDTCGNIEALINAL